MKAALLERLDRPRRELFEGRWRIESGAIGDYDGLCSFHYRAGRPATVCGVWRVVFEGAGERGGQGCGRQDVPGGGDPALKGPACAEAAWEKSAWEGPAWEMPARVVGAAVLSMPALRGRQRDAALDRRYAAIRSARQRARMLNDELRCISRVVVHPQFRGLGLAVKLVRRVLRDAPTPLVEALAAMGHVHPFFEKAGMTAYRRPPHPYDARLADALATAGIDRASLMQDDEAQRLILRLPQPRRCWIERELRRWRQHAVRGEARDGDDSQANLRAARQRLFCEPVYYLYARKDGTGCAAAEAKQPRMNTDERR